MWLRKSAGTVTPEEALTLRASPGTPVYRFHRIRFADEVPMALEYATILAECLPSLDAVESSESVGRTLRVRIHDFVRQNIGDRRLSAETIAAAHHISSRLVYKLFQEDGLTVNGWIRDLRLELCARALADPHHNHRPIRAIATQFGFDSSAHFTRIFRARYGTTPSEFRSTRFSRPPDQYPHPA